MIWTAAKMHIESVNVTKPTPPSTTLSLTLTGGGFIEGIGVFVVHISTTAVQLVSAIQNGKDDEGVVLATDVELAGQSVSCNADMKGKKKGTYDVVATQVNEGALEVAVKASAFQWP
jgi:hypothetical protein